MRKRVVDLTTQRPALDLVSYGRRGPGQQRSLTSAEIAHVSRTVGRVPEVVIKVSGGARTLAGVSAHLDYISHEGSEPVETDEGTRLHGKCFEKALVESWDLDLDAQRNHTQRSIAAGRKPPKLVHNLVFSMPKGTPPDKLLAAVQVFAREKFALQHRYAMVLHTDQGHPHLHVVVRAKSEQGGRLNIRKAMLREWRLDFAQYLRHLGVEANATERAVRGEVTPRKPDGIYRAMLRGESTHYHERLATARSARPGSAPDADPGRDRLMATRSQVIHGWNAAVEVLDEQGHVELAAMVRRFVRQMPPARTEQEWLTQRIHNREASVSRPDPVRTR
jgi:MobA/VirD2-like, nuclease domain